MSIGVYPKYVLFNISMPFDAYCFRVSLSLKVIFRCVLRPLVKCCFAAQILKPAVLNKDSIISLNEQSRLLISTISAFSFIDLIVL